MRIFAIILVLAAAIVGVLFALGIFDSTPVDDPGGGGPSGNGRGSSDPGGDGNGPMLVAPPPEDRPDLEQLPLRDSLNVLLLAGIPQRFNLFLAQQWSRDPRMRVTSWSPPIPPGAEAAGVPSADVLPGARKSPPGAGTLHDDDIAVLALHDFDPSSLDDEFWRAVSERVREGRLGLYVQPGLTHGQAMLAHPILRELLPVAVVKPIEGQPLPGNFSAQVPFRITDEGVRHPASRLVAWPTWSERIWDATKLGEHPWGTRFAYPVEELAEGGVVLLTTAPPRGKAWPALIVGDEKSGRVMWMGAWDLGSRHAYGQPTVVRDWGTLLRNWAVWLGGRVPNE